jgi:pimeloyl-ACP methyl ester carboxylesterase
MTQTRQILFIQGGGAGAHDHWDDKLFDALRRGLGDGYEVRYPRMPDEADPSYARWSVAILREIAVLADGVVVGHSVGRTILIHALAERPSGTWRSLIAARVGADGWPGTEFELPPDLERLRVVPCICSMDSGQTAHRRMPTCTPGHPQAQRTCYPDGITS